MFLSLKEYHISQIKCRKFSGKVYSPENWCYGIVSIFLAEYLPLPLWGHEGSG